MSQKIVLEIKNLAKEIENSSNLNTSVLKNKVSELYNKLVVLEFLEDSIASVEESQVEKLQVEETRIEEEIIESTTNKISDVLDFSKEEEEEEVEIIVEVETINNYTESTENVNEEITTSDTIEKIDSTKSLNESIDAKKSSLHEELKKNYIQIGLNDRIAFVKRLFDGSQQDFHRVLSQVNTFSTIDEVKEFIDTMVRPEHNWENQEEYAERFMEIIEVKFQ